MTAEKLGEMERVKMKKWENETMKNVEKTKRK